MIWMKEIDKPQADRKYKKWFAWYPVRLSNTQQTAWLHLIERKVCDFRSAYSGKHKSRYYRQLGDERGEDYHGGNYRGCKHK